MEDYPSEYVEHNLPLILVSGLGIAQSTSTLSIPPARQESGTKLVIDSVECSPDRAKPILEQLLLCDSTDQPWTAPSPTGAPRYKIKTIGRSYVLPSRKAAPLPQSPIGDPVPGKQSSSELHSPLSPLSPGSPVFPDGIMSPIWFAKHQQHVPALILAFFDITAAGGALQDSAIRGDINAIRAALSRSGFRVRFAAVLISDRSIVQSSELEERITAIRRSTTLDAKTGLFLMPPMSTSEDVNTFVMNALTTLQPICVEYYRELTKHARRKKARSTAPITPTTPAHGTAQALSSTGWNARYEVKQGVFAEFRQEIDVAERHYSQAIYELCSDDGIFETTTGWSLRWDEARLLSDTLALRVIRCLLFSGLTTAAAQSWFEYRNRMRSIVDRKGKGSHTYGWLAWESRWARIMAQLVQAADLPAFDSPARPRNERPAGPNSFLTYAASEKSLQSFERLPAVYLLHHAGYWDKMAIRSARARYASALAIPAEDRTPPDQSPASSVARKAQEYDTYLVQEPHDEYENARRAGQVESVKIAQLTEQAISNFTERDQRRNCDQLALDLARDHIDEGSFDLAFEVLVPIWDATSWRQEEWHHLFGQLLSLLNRCAKAVRNAEIALATFWELSSILAADIQQDDLTASLMLDELEIPADVKVALEFHNHERLSPISATFAFSATEAYAGEPTHCQLVMQSRAPSTAQPVKISEVQLHISSLDVIIITGSDEVSRDQDLANVILAREERGLVSSTCLTLAPGQRRVLSFDIVFKEASTAQLEKAVFSTIGDRYSVVHAIDEPALLRASSIYHISSGQLAYAELRSENSTTVQVSPKPPKVDLVVKHLKSQYVLSEKPQLTIQVVNNEREAIHGSVSVRAVCQGDHTELPASVRQLNQAKDSPVPELDLSDLAPAESIDLALQTDSPTQPSGCIVSVLIRYEMPSDPGVPLEKSIDITLHFVKFLDMKWSFGPLLHQGQWPSYFDSTQDDSLDKPSGIPQTWKAALVARTAISQEIVVRKAYLEIDKKLTDAVCSIADTKEAGQQTFPAVASFDRDFQVTTQKFSADDRRPVTLDLYCMIEWSRTGSVDIHKLKTPVPRMSLPSAEPRVLCTVSYDRLPAADAVIHYHLENPSAHFLTFSLTMAASEDFAFSGVKYRTLSLAPLSRFELAYGLLLHSRPDPSSVKGRWVFPNLQVIDSYYNKTLHVQPAGPGVKIGKDGEISVWIGPSAS